MEKLIKRHTSLSANLVQLCRYLRNENFNISVNEEKEALQALMLVPLTNSEMMRSILQAVLVKNYPQSQVFEALYQKYWDELEKAIDSKTKDQESDKQIPRPQNDQKIAFDSLKNWLYGNKNEDELEIALFDTSDNLTKKDFGLISESEMAELAKWIRKLVRQMANQPTRRYIKSKKQIHLNLRQTMRQNLRRGGEILHLAFQKPKKQKLKLVLLCDVSKSMDLYSKFLIQFLYAMQNEIRHIETFVFSTSLLCISEQLAGNDLHKTLSNLSETVPHWSGGTKIGASLHDFDTNFAWQCLDKKTITIILSDGWDVGETELLENAMHNIYRKSKLLIWLNPLAGNPNYQPATEAMQIALPYIDIFAPIHNLESLKDLMNHLKKGKRKK